MSVGREDLEGIRKGWHGKNPYVAFVFPCPGSEEHNTNKPLAGRNGDNLNQILRLLQKEKFLHKFIFDSVDRYNYSIFYASEKMHYRDYDGITEPGCKEIWNKENIDRLTKELCHFNFIVTFGSKACCAVQMCHLPKVRKIIAVNHLSLQSLNRIKYDRYGNPLPRNRKGNTKKRLMVICSSIINQIEN